MNDIQTKAACTQSQEIRRLFRSMVEDDWNEFIESKFTPGSPLRKNPALSNNFPPYEEEAESIKLLMSLDSFMILDSFNSQVVEVTSRQKPVKEVAPILEEKKQDPNPENDLQMVMKRIVDLNCLDKGGSKFILTFTPAARGKTSGGEQVEIEFAHNRRTVRFLGSMSQVREKFGKIKAFQSLFNH